MKIPWSTPAQAEPPVCGSRRGKAHWPVRTGENSSSGKQDSEAAEASRLAATKRGSLLEAAKHGDEDAIETLTIEDIDAYSMVSRRILHEDMYSIIETCFMPCGVECDQYSVIGNILDVEVKQNRITKEDVYCLKLDCNDVTFTVAINKKDLLGEPRVGRRLRGRFGCRGP